MLQEDAEAVSDKLKAANSAARERSRARPDLIDADSDSLWLCGLMDVRRPLPETVAKPMAAKQTFPTDQEGSIFRA